MNVQTQRVDVLAKTSFAGRGHARWMVIAGANPREKGIHDAGFGHYGVTAATVSFEHEYSHNPELGAELAADYADRLVACADAMKGIADPRAFIAAVAELVQVAAPATRYNAKLTRDETDRLIAALAALAGGASHG